MTIHEEQIRKMLPVQMEGWCTPEKGVVLFDLIQKYQPKTILEIGTFGGRSTLCLAYGLKVLGRGIVFGIDPWRISPCLEGTNAEANNEWWKCVPWGKVIREYFDYLQAHDLLEYHCHLRKHDIDCLNYFRDCQIDMVHFDSNHSEEVACRTVKDWFPKLAPGCVIVMDDIDWAGQAKAVDVLRDFKCHVIQTYDSYGIYQKPDQNADSN